MLDRLEEGYEVVCVNDGSRDGTLEALLAMRALRQHVRVIDLSRNWQGGGIDGGNRRGAGRCRDR